MAVDGMVYLTRKGEHLLTLIEEEILKAVDSTHKSVLSEQGYLLGSIKANGGMSVEDLSDPFIQPILRSWLSNGYLKFVRFNREID